MSQHGHSAPAGAQVRHRLEQLARAGYLTKGIVYGLIGVLAAQAAFGAGGATTDSEGALRSIVVQPFGRVLLALITAGLSSYALWRLAQALLDSDSEGDDASGLATRAAALGSGVVYAGLAITAGRLVLGAGGGSGDGPEDISARLMSWPIGVWLVGIAGLVAVGAGLYRVSDTYRASFREDLKRAEMSAEEWTWAVRVGRVAQAVRGMVFVMIGGFLVQAALGANPERAGGLGDALATLARQPFGPWLLGTFALGLIVYGIYLGVLARYRRINV